MTEPLRLVCASANPDKVAEIAAILGDAVELLPRPADVPDVVEDADTLEGNARLKAAAICAATGLAAVADDTGLEVDALGGAPGVYAARYAGEGCTLRRQPAQAARRARRPRRSARPVPHGGAGALARRLGAGRRRRVPGHDQPRGAWRPRVRLRRRVRARRGRRPHVRRDVRGREARRVAPRPGVPQPARRAPTPERRSPAAQVDRPAVDHLAAAHEPRRLVHRHRRIDVGGHDPHAVADATGGRRGRT